MQEYLIFQTVIMCSNSKNLLFSFLHESISIPAVLCCFALIMFSPKINSQNINIDGTCSLYKATQEHGRGATAQPATQTRLATFKVPAISGNQWHNLKIQFSDKNIIGFVDQTKVLTASDTTFPNGMAGFVTGGEKDARNTAYFDNLVIKSTDSKTPEPTVFPKNVNPMYNSVVK